MSSAVMLEFVMDIFNLSLNSSKEGDDLLFWDAKPVLECAPLEQRVDIPESLFLIQAVSRLDLGYEIILALEGSEILFWEFPPFGTEFIHNNLPIF
jgi:hypothetical protein